jgi:flavin reductase (DIM6/NTAB) family NADH-FMN oxidoreductase RutF
MSEPDQASGAPPGRVAADEFRRAMARLPTAVTVVTAIGPDGPSGLTANAVVSLSLDPPLMLACLDRGARTLRAVEHAGRFGISELGAGHAELARRFSTKAPQPDKWDGVAWSDRHGIPALDEALVWIGCELENVLAGGDHVIVTGAVLEVEAHEGEPLVFHDGEYRPLG